MDYRDSNLFHVLEDTVRKQNAWKLGLVQPASRPPSPGPASAAGSAQNSRRSSYAGGGGGGGGGVAGGGGEGPELARVHSTSRRVSYAGEAPLDGDVNSRATPLSRVTPSPCGNRHYHGRQPRSCTFVRPMCPQLHTLDPPLRLQVLALPRTPLFCLCACRLLTPPLPYSRRHRRPPQPTAFTAAA